MRPLYTLTAVAAPGRCVPRPKAREVTRQRYAALAVAAAFGRPMFIAFTEAWFRECRAGIRAGLPDGYRLLAPFGNSTVLAYDTRQVTLLESGRLWLHGFIAGRWGLASDPRRMPWGMFTVNGTRRKVRVGAYHVTPRRRDLGDDAARATLRAQESARERVNARMGGYYPGLVLGDFNSHHPGIGDRPLWASSDPIIRAQLFHGEQVDYGGAGVEYPQPRPGFDHMGLRVAVTAHRSTP